MSFMHSSGKVVNVNTIGVYRGCRNPDDNQLLCHLKRMIDINCICLISGDFNLNFRKENANIIISGLKNMNFLQLIDEPTHTNGGIIDHLYIYRPAEFHDVIINWELFAPFYSDHFGISVTINKGNNPIQSLPSTVPDELLLTEDQVPKAKNNSDKRKKDGSTAGSKSNMANTSHISRAKRR